MKTCYTAFKGIAVTYINDELRISVCPKVTPVVVNKIEFYSDADINNIRQSWLHNKEPNECNWCAMMEQARHTSRREGMNQWFIENQFDSTKVELVHIDFWPSNECNLRCLTCGPQDSTAWAKELGIQHRKTNKNLEFDLPLDAVRLIHFHGGEPLLNKTHHELLKRIPDKETVQLIYNTNGTVIPSTELLNIWQEFQCVQILFSIDHINEKFELLRYPAKWNNVCSNVNWFYHNAPSNCLFGVNLTVSVLNEDDLPIIETWISAHIKGNRDGDQMTYIKQPANGFFDYHRTTENAKKIIQFLDECDYRRGTNWRQVLPNVEKKLLNYCKT